MAKDLTLVEPRGFYILLQVDDDDGLAPVYVGTVVSRGQDVPNQIADDGETILVGRTGVRVSAPVTTEPYRLALVHADDVLASVSGEMGDPSVWA